MSTLLTEPVPVAANFVARWCSALAQGKPAPTNSTNCTLAIGYLGDTRQVAQRAALLRALLIRDTIADTSAPAGQVIDPAGDLSRQAYDLTREVSGFVEGVRAA